MTFNLFERENCELPLLSYIDALIATYELFSNQPELINVGTCVCLGLVNISLLNSNYPF